MGTAIPVYDPDSADPAPNASCAYRCEEFMVVVMVLMVVMESVLHSSGQHIRQEWERKCNATPLY